MFSNSLNGKATAAAALSVDAALFAHHFYNRPVPLCIESSSAMKPENLRFAKTHEWVAVDGNVATIGISDFAVKLLTDIVYLSLPAVGKKFSPGQSMGEIESVKAVSEIYAPVQGEVAEVNSALPDNLPLLNDSPFENAWIVKIRMSDPSQVSQLLSYSDYKKHCESGGH